MSKNENGLTVGKLIGRAVALYMVKTNCSSEYAIDACIRILHAMKDMLKQDGRKK